MNRPLPPIVVAVEFPSSSKKYHYLCEWHDVQVGDTVQTPTGVAQVAGFADRSAYPDHLKSIIAWYPKGGQERRVAKQTRIDQLHNEIMKLQREHERMALYESITKKIPAARPLLKELKELLK